MGQGCPRAICLGAHGRERRGLDEWAYAIGLLICGFRGKWVGLGLRVIGYGVKSDGLDWL